MATRFVHTLLFACPECNLPVAVSRISKEKNLEGVDAEQLHIRKESSQSCLRQHCCAPESWPNLIRTS